MSHFLKVTVNGFRDFQLCWLAPKALGKIHLFIHLHL